MAKGSATGADREYQVSCKNVLLFRDPTLSPWLADGVDVPFQLEDTTWTFDVALRSPNGRAVVAECKRHVGAVKQGDLAEFAWKVERLRGTLGIEVSGIYFAKTAHQYGAVKVGQFSGIEVIVLDEKAKPPGFRIVYMHYDATRERKLRAIVFHVPLGDYELTGFPVTFTHVKKDGTTKSR